MSTCVFEIRLYSRSAGPTKTRTDLGGAIIDVDIASFHADGLWNDGAVMQPRNVMPNYSR